MTIPAAPAPRARADVALPLDVHAARPLAIDVTDPRRIRRSVLGWWPVGIWVGLVILAVLAGAGVPGVRAVPATVWISGAIMLRVVDDLLPRKRDCRAHAVSAGAVVMRLSRDGLHLPADGAELLLPWESTELRWRRDWRVVVPAERVVITGPRDVRFYLPLARLDRDWDTIGRAADACGGRVRT